MGHFLLGRFVSQEAGPHLNPLGPPDTASTSAWVKFEQVDLFIFPKVLSISEAAISSQKS